MTLTVKRARRAIKAQGPCLICGVPGEYAAHRWIDSAMGRVAAGDHIDAVADDYDMTTPELVTYWVAYIELLK